MVENHHTQHKYLHKFSENLLSGSFERVQFFMSVRIYDFKHGKKTHKPAGGVSTL
jgi:hypothetical protein